MRKEMKAFAELYPSRKSVGQVLRKLKDKYLMSTFERKLRKIVTGSPEWQILQEKLTHGAPVGIEMEMRNLFYMRTLPRCGEKLYVFPHVVMYYPRNIEIGYNVFINRGAFFTAPEKIVIGDNVLIGPYAVLNSGSHLYSDPSRIIRDQGHKLAPIIVANDVWIGSLATILPGVTLGEGSVIAAGAVVTRSVEPYTVVAGVPARILTQRIQPVET